MTIKETLKKNKFIYLTYKYFKNKIRSSGKYVFINRSKNNGKLCIVLAGYKEYLWDAVFERLKRYLEEDIDVCIMSSGIYDEKLKLICDKYNWSYLSTKKNKLTLIQNIAIDLHPNAKLIYKIDEDIFITCNFFKILEKTYLKVLFEDKYKIGFVGALLNVHGYGSLKILERLGKLSEAEKKFGKIRHTEMEEPVYTNPAFARYMWGEGLEEMNNLDNVADMFAKDSLSYTLSPFRFAIGAILFPRKTWEDMGKFPVKSGTNMGMDEVYINQFCFLDSRVIVVAENTIVGHFCYYPQNESMKHYYKTHKNIFRGS